jgi:hypothetical protein
VAFPNVEGYDEDGIVVPSSVSVPLRSPPSGMVVLGKESFAESGFRMCERGSGVPERRGRTKGDTQDVRAADASSKGTGNLNN